jgi:hypothetical protein
MIVGVPTLTRYDCLQRLLHSLDASTRPPDAVWIVDNGGGIQGADVAYSNRYPITIHCPGPVSSGLEPYSCALGLAESWNWLIAHTLLLHPADPILLVNDDIVFGPTALETIAAAEGAFVTPLPGQAFSCFRLSYACVLKVGLFDETISPGYAYFEDDDYAQRMKNAGIPITPVAANVQHLHGGSSTLKAYTPEELEAHHQKFRRAEANFVNKWGHLPHKENLG